ncbi:GNAT family N-acetyltransferase [Levilactobacillus cerevisiae]|uniref:GNAT family N-acetyltransferase n=1 Tax=Levilactobacillus cerevisiae TaxID=1704076 RepID=UPI000F7754B7|nr:GNAT family N-acetyltransferase [Levilactobacillus cerevisiae]
MQIRRYQATDLADVIQLFRATISEVNQQDYSPAQLAAWLGPDTPAVRNWWQKTLLAHQTYVALVADELVGFADMTGDGYLDHLFVSADHQRAGIATALLTTLEQTVPEPYTTDASLTAQPFFKARGYRRVKRNLVVRDGVGLINETMTKIDKEKRD